MRIAAASLIMAMILLALPSVACGGEALQGERIVFTASDVSFNDTVYGRDGKVAIYAMNPDGSGVKQLTNHNADDSHPDLSPDGQRIAFISNRDGNFEIYAMNADGSDVIRLTNNAAADLQPAWSPDGQRIVYVSNRYDDRSDSLLATEIHVMNSDGSDLIRLVNDDAWQSAPAWSPDGQRIAFASRGRDGNSEIYAANADGTEITQLTNHDAGDWQPAWSPDGRRIAFVSDRDADRSGYPSDSEIYSMNADGSDLTRLTHNDLTNRSPVWSPDGRRIAFSASRGHAHSSIWTMNADGSEIRQFFGGHNPIWSPDGQRIAFGNYPGDGDIIRGDNEIYVMNSDGSGMTQLTDNDADDWIEAWESAP